MKTSELLRKAAGEIRRRGWIQNHLGESSDVENCAVCAIGAVNAAACGSPFMGLGPGERAPLDILETLLEEDCSGYVWIANYNDAPGRTVDDVLDLFERAAVRAEADGD